jgi:hypothetical protein
MMGAAVGEVIDDRAWPPYSVRNVHRDSRVLPRLVRDVVGRNRPL